MAQTKAQIRDRVLRKLGKLALGQVAEAALASDIEDAYDQMHERLKFRGLVTWDSSNVPDEFVEDVVAITAFDRAEGIPAERYARIESAAARATINISATLAGKWVNPRNVEEF